MKASTGDDPITQLTYQYMVSEAPPLPLGYMQLKSGTAFDGVWEGRWNPPDLACNGQTNLQLDISPTNRNGKTSVVLTFRSGPNP